MKRLIIMAALSALVIAKPKPETYRETEDFQYSRSSTDEGHKAGYYGAQRGNMGGNYERAHNMDLLAQHQMSGLVRQVDGELGEGAKTRTGSVYTAANSRGIYGSGHYDLTNLKGRNFAEGESKGNSQAYVAQTSQNSGYRGHSYSGMNSGFSSQSNSQAHQAHDARYSGYQSLGHIDQTQIDNLQSVDTLQGFGGYEHDNQAGYNANYHTQYGSHGQSEFDQSSSNLHRSSGYDANTRSRYITTPVRVVLRPSGRVAIPISAPTYSLTDGQTVLVEDKNALNRDAEILNQQSFIPTNKAKHYESSYSYRKQWEKHHTQPAEVAVVVPTENPFPKNSELYDDEQLLQSAKDQLQTANLQTAHASNINSEHRAHTKSAASTQSMSQSAINSHHSQSGFNAQQSSASSGSFANAYGHSGQKSGMTADLTNAAVENLDLKPKSYQSSYSYHKSWERQGDPYVIKPISSYDGQSSQRLTAASANSAAYSSHHYGTHSKQAHQTYIADCDDEGHIRVARSYDNDQFLQQQQQNQWEDLTQQSQGLERLEDLGQQTQSMSENLEDFGQQQQNNLEYLGQQTQNQFDNLQDLGQQTQNQWDNLQQFGQETQNQFDNLQQLDQQTQNKWNRLEDLDQHTQSGLEQTPNGNLEDFSQQTQKEDTLINFEQQNNGEDTADLRKNYTQQESQLNTNTWEQIAGFEPQGNAQKTYDNTNANTDNSENFARPILEPKDNNEHNSRPHSVQNVITNEKPNLFDTSLNNKEFKSPWEQNNNENIFWNSNVYQNTDKNSMSHFWQMNENNNFKEHHLNFNSYSPIDSGSHIQSLWNKIDNIAGEISAAEVNTQNNNFYSHDFSNFYSNGHNVNHKQNDFDWTDTSGFSNFHTAHFHTDDNKDNNSEHHNLFDEQIPIESTTVKLNFPLLNLGDSVPNTKPIEPVSTQDHIKPHPNGNIHSSDEGRGDIGPEETLFDFSTTRKPYKTQEEVDILSLTKETTTGRPKDIIVQPSIFKNKENTDSTLTVVNMSTNENKNQNKQDEFINNFHFKLPSTTPAMEIGIKPKETTPKHNSVFQVQKPQEQIADSLETPKDIQQNLEQQFEDFDQQLQGSWFSSDNLQHGYDQQNVEQQFEVFHHESDKPYKTAQEIETLSLTKETVSEKPKNIISSTTPLTQIITTPQQPTPDQKPIINVIEKDNPSTYVQKHKPQTEMQENVEIPIDTEQKNLEQQFEDFDQQLQGSWFSSDNLQEQQQQQQNTEQFQVFHQFENDKLYKTPQELETLRLAKERSGIIPTNVVSSVTPIIQVGTLPKGPISDEPEIPEDIQQQTLQQQSEDLQQIPVQVIDQQNTEEQFKVIHQQSNLEATPSTAETQTEKPGFWKSVGSKFSNAKEKVVSWFKSI